MISIRGVCSSKGKMVYVSRLHNVPYSTPKKWCNRGVN
nr:MAG TPA: hypothetical protein [Caudoviricetes sp.]